MNEIVLTDCFPFMMGMKNKSIDLSFTSPPYNRVRNDTYKYFDDVNKNYGDMLVKLTKELLRITKKDVIINIQQNMCNKKDVFSWLGKFSDKIKGVIIWEKTNPHPNINYRKSDNSYSITNAFEYFFIFSDVPQEFRANKKITNIIRTPVNSEHFEGHSAVMRLDVAEKMIVNFSNKNDIIFDPFMGCGTTAVACEKNGRKYLGCEIIHEYKNIADKRIKDLLLSNNLFESEAV